ncbi:uncharacterized protein MEPE_00967 [Melanopsichium pennsylvanicum]|uniref:Uncharacterized protein n=2 Tax=Melanopsichium pennsylvanicum TaxID=63383 RepID=A0AAJ5C360_9BASI|nr:putative protein [Melanopsichium pennsylvanicum 4]SNX82261.1 uncharacterized protein MEPE_00967 [Melanopsichium pennsylvanicum]
MLAVRPPSETRFNRTLFDVDRAKPSPFGWKRCSHTPRRFVRRMGLVESFFNTMATLHEGRTDIFYRIPLKCPANAYDKLLRRLPLVWALLCRRHPLLAAYVESLTPDGTTLAPEEAASRRHAGEAAEDGSSSFEPHFVFELPDSAPEILEQASQRILLVPETWQGDVSAQRSGNSPSRSDAVVSLLDEYVWNGKRRFLQQNAPYGLARLILLPPTPSGTTTARVSFDLILCTAHCISDGLSISSLAGELLQTLASPQLTLKLPELVLMAERLSEIASATSVHYTSVSQDMQQALLSGQLGFDTDDSGDTMNEGHFASLLPPSIEATYPELLPTPPATAGSGTATSASRLARLRWFWTIRRVICQIRAADAEKAVLSNFKANRTDKNVKEPWWGAQTKWSVVRLSAQDTFALTKVAKRKGIRVGSLLYAVSACALNTLENIYTTPDSRLKGPTTTVMGFPFSVRRWLDARAPIDALQTAGREDPLLPPSSLGVKLGFNGIGVPPAELFSLSAPPSKDSKELSSFQAAQLWQIARQVQKQFNSIFAEPRFMHADGFLMGLERETRFRKNGVKDVLQVFKDEQQKKVPNDMAGEDERRPGLTKKNMQGPGSSLNFSMVGLLDPVLPSKLALPFAKGQGEEVHLETGDDLMFGVRTRAGEAFGTSFTFKGQLNLELGHDTVVWDTDKVLEYLELMKYIVEAIVAFEQRRS